MNGFRFLFGKIKVMILIGLPAVCLPSVEFDILLKNATIYDGSGQMPYTGSIGISGDRIEAIGAITGAKGKQELDLNGLAVAPGFINMLSWACRSLIEDGRSQSDIRQGVTLEVMGEGFSMGPLSDAMKAKRLNNQTDIKFDIEWTTLGQYLAYLEKRGVSTNVASFVGHGTLREYVIGMENRPATHEELQQMKELVKQAMQEGAVGFSSALIYQPSSYADTKELVELAKIASQYHGMYISHIRNEGSQLVESVQELISIARHAKVDSEIYHFKASGIANWHQLDEAIELIEKARSEGIQITADMYTYHASSTGLSVQLPDWVRDGGMEKVLTRLEDPLIREKILGEMKLSHPPENIMLLSFKNKALRKFSGKRLNEVAELSGKSPTETALDLIAEDKSRIGVAYFSMDEKNVAKKVALPWMSFCSDAGSYTTEGVFISQPTHPRAYGSFARVLGKFSRDEGLLTLQEAVRKLSALPAQNLKLEQRGMLKKGYFADVVVFDPEKIQDNATFQNPHQYATGMVHVWVNGVQVLNNGEHTQAKPGRFVMGPGVSKR